MLKRIIIKNFKGIKSLDLEFNDIRTILVGNNGVGKSTIIEALRLALSGENSVELTLFSFHKSCWSVTDRAISNLPKIEIEVYFSDIVKGPDFRGKSNLLIEEHPGIRFTYEFDEAYEDLYSHTTHDYVPCEYYHTTRFWFSGQPAKQNYSHSNCLSSILQTHSLIVDRDNSCLAYWRMIRMISDQNC